MIYGRLGGELEADARWERALLWWAVVAVGVLVVAILCGLPTGTTPARSGGAIALVAGTEAVLVLATLIVWLISG